MLEKPPERRRLRWSKNPLFLVVELCVATAIMALIAWVVFH